MTSSRAIPLIRQIAASPVVDILREAGAPVRALLHQAQLPTALEQGRDGFIAARAMLGFLERAAASQDIPNLSWRAAARAPIERLGGWGRHLTRCVTLRDAIESFCARYPQAISFVQLGLEHGETHASFWRSRPPEVRSWQGDVQGEQFMLASMIRVVRLAAGPDWIPHRIELESARSTWIREIPALSASEVAFGGPVMAIAVPYDLLDRSLFSRCDGSADEGALPELLIPSASLSGSLQQAIAPLLPEFCPSLAMAAEMARTSPRTLRRRLAEEGTSWRQVVDRARFDACDRMLRDPKLTLATIAGELGYSDQAHLTRAFRRWTGECPSDYRRRRRY